MFGSLQSIVIVIAIVIIVIIVKQTSNQIVPDLTNPTFVWCVTMLNWDSFDFHPIVDNNSIQ